MREMRSRDERKRKRVMRKREEIEETMTKKWHAFLRKKLTLRTGDLGVVSAANLDFSQESNRGHNPPDTRLSLRIESQRAHASQLKERERCQREMDKLDVRGGKSHRDERTTQEQRKEEKKQKQQQGEGKGTGSHEDENFEFF